MGVIAEKRGDQVAALDYLEQAVKIFLKNYGPDHQLTKATTQMVAKLRVQTIKGINAGRESQIKAESDTAAG
jgi:hypothetical protein